MIVVFVGASGCATAYRGPLPSREAASGAQVDVQKYRVSYSPVFDTFELAGSRTHEELDALIRDVSVDAYEDLRAAERLESTGGLLFLAGLTAAIAGSTFAESDVENVAATGKQWTLGGIVTMGAGTGLMLWSNLNRAAAVRDYNHELQRRYLPGP